jgi:hypothetical protein
MAGEPIIGHALPCGRADGFVGFAKALVLGRLALEDLTTRLRPPPVEPDGMVALYLALSDRHLQDRAATSPDSLDPGEAAPPPEQWPSANWRGLATHVGERLSAEPVARRLGIGGCRVLLGGHTALARALAEAASHLAAGRIARAYVAAIDSLIEPRELQAAATVQKLKTVERAVGFIPGEAAVCLAVESTEGADAGDASIVVGGLGYRRCESGAAAFVGGRALAEAMHEAGAAWPTPGGIAAWDLAGDLNGDPRRADEWGHCAIAWQAVGAGALGVPEWIAASIGECGTAGPAAQIALLLHRARRGRRSPRPTLMPLSSDDGEKAALVVH